MLLQPSQTDAEKLHGAMEVIFGNAVNNSKFFALFPNDNGRSRMLMLTQILQFSINSNFLLNSISIHM